ncbi:hypothetical protein DFJ58DRAFT_728629 [Suillus subalutaceus]|uniref:uncharacterized protein n=1 Tax=Suillus subalutaceus TaxID=48586 RepID=UPI001B865333|nr:uncharacterized protein DFJ58DRAFT_728629 [Suillus subalutaceus]KAG1852295.1 hypothetical protein DFJ58DRAFT_728629 [Suillus subalutaceus]
MPPKKSSSTKKCANPRMETPVIDFVMRTRSGAPINQCMLQTKTLPPAKKIKPTPLPRGNSFMSFDDYSAILARRAKSSVATTEPRTDAESDTQDHPKTDDLVTDDEDNSEGQADAHKGDPKIHESLPPSDTPEDENSSLDGAPSSENNYPVILPLRKRSLTKMMMNTKKIKKPTKKKKKADNNNRQRLTCASIKDEIAPEARTSKSSPPKIHSNRDSPVHPGTPGCHACDDEVGREESRLQPGRLCQEGIDDAQELGRKTLHAAKLIGDKYGKSARTILIEAGLSVKHSRAETPWNMHQGWYKGKYPRETDEELSDWRKRQRDHYYSLEDSDPLWDDIQAHYDGHLGGASNNRSHASIVMSTRDALAKRLILSLEGIEVIGCVFDSTPDEAARQASGFVAGSSTFMDVINERQVDAQLALDWIITAAKYVAWNYSKFNLTMCPGQKTTSSQCRGLGGAYDILFSKPGEAPWDRYRRIWPVMVLEKLEQFGYKTKSVQWRKLLDVAYQNKFQFELWPDEVPPVGPDFNYHTLSAQHLKLLVVPYIKRRALQYYDAELKTEAESLLELQAQARTERKKLLMISLTSWTSLCLRLILFLGPKVLIALFIFMSNVVASDHIEQCEKDDPNMFDIPLVTSASNIVLRKLADSEKFKHSIPQGLLQKYKEATSVRGSNVGVPSGRKAAWRYYSGSPVSTTDLRCSTPPIGVSATEVSQATTCRGLWQVHELLADSLLIECPADEQLESEADSLNASDSRITKKSKVVRHRDGAPHVELPPPHFVPAHPRPRLQSRPRPRPRPRLRAPTPDYEPRQHWDDEVQQVSPHHLHSYGHNVAHHHRHDFPAAGPSRVVARARERSDYDRNTPAPGYDSYDRDFVYRD